MALYFFLVPPQPTLLGSLSPYTRCIYRANFTIVSGSIRDIQLHYASSAVPGKNSIASVNKILFYFYQLMK